MIKLKFVSFENRYLYYNTLDLTVFVCLQDSNVIQEEKWRLSVNFLRTDFAV